MLLLNPFMFLLNPLLFLLKGMACAFKAGLKTPSTVVSSTKGKVEVISQAQGEK